MAFQLPQQRALRSIQTTKRNIPLEQILAVEGQNPLATGIETAGNVIGQTLQKRADLQRQGQQLAKLEQLAGQAPGAYAGLDPSMANSLAEKQITLQTQNYNPLQVAALQSGDPAQLSTAFPKGVPKDAASLFATSSSRDENRALREQQMKLSEMEREKNRNDKRSKEKVDIVSKFNADPGVRKIQSSTDAAANVRELATSGNPIAANAIPTYMARASGEVGNLSEADKRPFGGSAAIIKRLQASYEQMATGQLTPDNRKFILDLADTMENSALNNLDRRAKEVSGQYGEASDYLKSDEIYKTLRPIKPPTPTAIQPPLSPLAKKLLDKHK